MPEFTGYNGIMHCLLNTYFYKVQVARKEINIIIIHVALIARVLAC